MRLFPVNTLLVYMRRCDEKWPSYGDSKIVFIPIFINFAKLNINYDVILSTISKNYLKTHRRLDYAIIKFTSSTPSLDNAIIKLRGAHTRQWGHSMRLFRVNTLLVYMCRCDEKWPSYGDSKIVFIPIFINFAKLNINYDVILSTISTNYLKTHPPP